MGIMDWFRGTAKGEKPAQNAPETSDKGAEIAGLNFKSAVDAHMKWKTRLETYIQGTSNEDLKVDVVCRDDQCPLGKWIYAKGGASFGYSETFFDMKAHHANFHRCAGDILANAQAGKKEEALRLLHHGDYVRASERVKMLLAKLFVLVSDGNAAIDSHMKWKARLYDVITGASKENLSVDGISRDDQCTLGHWLNGVGKEHYGHLPEYAKVCSRHTHFHHHAGQVLALAQKGDAEAALAYLEEGEYSRASQEVTEALVDLFTKVKQ